MTPVFPKELLLRVTTAPPVVSPWRYQVLAALQVLDVCTTYALLRWFAADEANPIADTIFVSTGLLGGCALLLWFKLTVVHLIAQRGSGVRLVTALYSVVAINNLLFLGMLGIRAWL